MYHLRITQLREKMHFPFDATDLKKQDCDERERVEKWPRFSNFPAWVSISDLLPFPFKKSFKCSIYFQEILQDSLNSCKYDITVLA